MLTSYVIPFIPIFKDILYLAYIYIIVIFNKEIRLILLI